MSHQSPKPKLKNCGDRWPRLDGRNGTDATDVERPGGVLLRSSRPELLAPSVRRALVDRPAIMDERSTVSDTTSLALVVAPAGYGKTTAVREWCASIDAALAWVTLEEGDNDPAQMWRYVATAVDRVREGLGRTRAAAA